jgi:hypothetical protein
VRAARRGAARPNRQRGDLGAAHPSRRQARRRLVGRAR